MSRYEIYHEDKALAFGTDHACGEYLQIWTLDKGRMPDVKNIIVDEDTVLTGMSRGKMLALLKEHGFTEDEMAQKYSQ